MSSRLLVALLISIFMMPAPVFTAEKKLVVYSSRKWRQMEPLFEEYSAKTGVRLIFIAGKAGNMLERLKEEGKNSPADIYYTVDAGYLWLADEAGLLQPLDSVILEKNIPDQYQGQDNTWFGLSLRASVIVYNTSTDAAQKLRSYEGLADDYWQGRLVLCSSKAIYSQSLVASLIAQHGSRKTGEIVSGWVENQVVNPFSTDTTALEAIAAGIGDVTMANSCCFAKMIHKWPELPLAIFWPNQESSGVHVNISGAGLTRWTKHREEAIKLLEWLSGKEAQELLMHVAMEYPVNSQVALIPTLESLGPFHADPVKASLCGELHDEALEIMKAARYR